MCVLNGVPDPLRLTAPLAQRPAPSFSTGVQTPVFQTRSTPKVGIAHGTAKHIEPASKLARMVYSAGVALPARKSSENQTGIFNTANTRNRL